MATAPFVCQKCGAALGIPPDPTSVSARCGYCNTETMLPAHILAVRRPPQPYGYPPAPMQNIQPITAMTPFSGGEAANKRMKMILWIVVLTTVIPLIFAGVIMWFVSSTISSVVPHFPHR